MFLKTKLTTIVMLIVFCINPCYADSDYFPSKDMYAFIQGGVYSRNFVTIDLEGVARVGVGVLKPISKRTKVGFETAYNYFETHTYEVIIPSFYYLPQVDIDLSYKRQSIDLLGVVDVNIIKKFGFFIKGGAAFVMDKGEMSATSLGQSLSESESRRTFVPKAAVGFGLDMTENANINLTFLHEFEKDKQRVFTPQASTLLLGFKYTF